MLKANVAAVGALALRKVIGFQAGSIGRSPTHGVVVAPLPLQMRSSSGGFEENPPQQKPPPLAISVTQL
jgi:hypothetical protein